ncbi:MAG TPA: exonuclease domain-containing protein [Candidatus Saccharimonadia bacterium]|nr:exonuclease domain-containing protein [Candidatus Saccharimonadia bacterium]
MRRALTTTPALLRQPLAFVDIETTGGSPARSRVLEIGVVRVEAGRVVAEFRSLVDPEQPVPAFITSITGIRQADTVGAPRFGQLAGKVAELLDGAVFVAHNVHFDYSFLRAEFERLGATFRPSLLCTVRLSRALYPAARGHKLQDLIDRHGLRADHRHRAYDDALVLWQFWQLVLRDFDLATIEAALARQLQPKPRLAAAES